MADVGLFIGWGAPVRGREAKGLDVFNEAVGFYGKCQEDGRVASFDGVLLEPHGGDLAGFFLLRGSTEQIGSLRSSEDFLQLMTRAGLIVEGLGVVGAFHGESLGQQIGTYQQAIGELG
ncbi:hypothetical protein BH24ACT25_BH24ACT25_10140 [soil metagenome]